jgi:uncharacterized protein YndB with AHSA1/START domain
MTKKLTAEVSKAIDTPVSKAWKALTDPTLIKQYLFGTDAHSDWKKGSKITYTGVWDGKPYEDKGVIVDIVPEKLLHTTYYSPLSGKEDKPENYNNVIYELRPEKGKTVITIKQDNIDNEEGVEHMKKNWGMVLDSMKKVLEE